MLNQSERILSARQIIDNLSRARRSARIYPDNNPITIKAVNELHSSLLKLLFFQSRISFDIMPDTISFELEDVFKAPSGENNIAGLLFRDGIRELVFKKGLTVDEVSGFVRILSSEPEHGSDGSDIVTRAWDRDFTHVRLIVSPESVIAGMTSGISMPEYRAVYELRTELLKAYRDATLGKEEEAEIADTIEFSDNDLVNLRKQIEGNDADRTGKLLAVVLELFLLSETGDEFAEIEDIMRTAMRHALAKGRIDVLADFFIKVKAAYMESSSRPLFRGNLSRIFSSFSSEEFLEKMGSLLDGGLRLDKTTFEKIALLLDKRAIPVLIGLLGYLDTISARRTVVNLLSKVGRSDVNAVTAGLNDSRWYVVRNTVIALRDIGDRAAQAHLVKISAHGDTRVRREAVKALAGTGGAESVGLLGKALDDLDKSVRQAALSALSELGLSEAKDILLGRVRSRAFLKTDFEEKKDFIIAVLGYKDEEVRLLLGKLLERKHFFRKAKNDENKLAIAYGVGIKGDRDYLPYLYTLGDDRNEMLQLAAAEAIRKIEHGN